MKDVDIKLEKLGIALFSQRLVLTTMLCSIFQAPKA